MRRGGSRGYGYGINPRKPHIITNPEDGRAFAAAGACFYALHPTDKELHVLLVHEGSPPGAPAAPPAPSRQSTGTHGDLASILRGLSLSAGPQEDKGTLWNFPGGKRREYSDEKPLDAAVRKVEEETHRQLGGAVTRPLLTAAHREYVAQSKYYLYMAELPDAWDLPDKIEAQLEAGNKHPKTDQTGAAWMSLSALKALDAQHALNPPPNWGPPSPGRECLSGFVPEALCLILKRLEAEEARLRDAAATAARRRLVEPVPVVEREGQAAANTSSTVRGAAGTDSAAGKPVSVAGGAGGAPSGSDDKCDAQLDGGGRKLAAASVRD